MRAAVRAARATANARARLDMRVVASRVGVARERAWASGASGANARGRAVSGARDAARRASCALASTSSVRPRAWTRAREGRSRARDGARVGAFGLSAADVGAAVLDGHSAWWAVASPLFALSVGPYLLFLKRMNDAESATVEMRQAFATLLLFVVISIPAEAYTKRAYGEVLSNIDALHFLIQSAISLTNLRILLAFRDGNARPSARASGGASAAMKEASATVAPIVGRPGAVVEAFAGVGLLATSLLLSLDERLLIVPDTAPAMVTSFVDAFRAWGDDFESASTAILGLPNPVDKALSVPTWGVHIFSLVEWLLAMGLVWNYADCERGNNKGWRALTWGMLPLHASGICACTQHFFGNVSSLDWLVAAQGAFTMLGNVGMCVAAGELARSNESTPVGASGASSSSECVVVDESESSWWDFDVENFGTKLWAEDEDGVFIVKVAVLSLAVASGVRGLSLSLSPAFDPVDGAWRNYTNIAAFLMVAAPLALNIEKWKARERVVYAREALSAVYAEVPALADDAVDAPPPATLRVETPTSPSATPDRRS